MYMLIVIYRKYISIRLGSCVHTATSGAVATFVWAIFRKHDMFDIVKRQLKKHEGFSSKPYLCPTGHLTIGYGYNLESGMTEELADLILSYQVEMIHQKLRDTFDWYPSLSSVRKNVIINMVFNLGMSGFKKFKNTIQLIADGDYEGASKNMLESLWAKQVGRRAFELARQMSTDAL